MMPNLASAPKFAAVLALLAGSAVNLFAQTNYYSANGGEYAVVGSAAGDQVFPDAAISTTGGFVVWQDNATDGDGWGISARRLDSTISGTLGAFRVNQSGAGSQENARVALLKNGGAAFVWQGGKSGFQHINAAFLTSTNTLLNTGDILVSARTNGVQINPAVTVLNNSNVVVVWASYNQAGLNSMWDVYGQMLSPAGQKLGGEFLVNQSTNFNQRAPAVAALANGGFVIAWVSEQQRVAVSSPGTNNTYITAAGIIPPSVDVYARQFNAGAAPAADEFLVSTNSNPCASPAVAAAPDGGFLVVWSARDLVNLGNSWDVLGRLFTSGNVGGAFVCLNSHLYGDQLSPRVSAIGLDYLVTWTSLAQDGSREGVYAQFVHHNGALVGGEFRVNTTTISQQMQPVVASDGVNQFLVVWTGFTGLPNNFDLFAQRYLNVAAALPAMSAPNVWVPFVVSNGVYQPRLVVSWAPLLGLPVTSYEVYVDGAVTPTVLVTNNQWTMTRSNTSIPLTASSTHSFQVGYVLTDGRHAPNPSPAASGTTWSSCNYMNSGVPCDWIAAMYGDNPWPYNMSAPLVPGGPTLLQVFLSGGNPFDSSTWLHQTMTRTAQGMFLHWNTQPGATYQVQMTSNFGSWNNLGSPRFAAGTTDSIYVGGGAVGYYRVLLLR